MMSDKLILSDKLVGRTMMSAVMDSLTHLFSSRRWPATRHRHSTAVNTQMDTTVVLLPAVPPTTAAAATSASHHAAAAAIDSLPASRPCPLFASLLLLPPSDGGFWRVAGGPRRRRCTSRRHAWSRRRAVPAWCGIPGATCVRGILAPLTWYPPGPACLGRQKFGLQKGRKFTATCIHGACIGANPL
jgi:hypothetical protein